MRMVSRSVCPENTISLQTTSSRWLAAVAVVIVVVAVIGITVAFLYRSGDLPLLPEGTPEGTVQRFLSTIEQGDSRLAYDYLSPTLQEDCSYQLFRDSIRWFESTGDRDSGDLRILLEETRPVADGVEVRVRIIRFYFSTPSPLAPAFDAGESSYAERFTLEMSGDEWLFVDPPWPMSRCPGYEEDPPPARPLRTAPR